MPVSSPHRSRDQNRRDRATRAHLQVNLVLYVVSGVFQPLFIMEMDYAGVGKQLGLLYMLPYYAGMACVL